MGEVDPAFIQDPEHRPKLSDNKAAAAAAADVDGIPLIDLSPISSTATGDHDPRELERLVREIGRACEEWGFFQVINHGVAAETRRRVDSVARKFFEQAAEEKRKVRRTEKDVLGYYDTELTKNVRDWKEVFDMAVVEPILVPSSPDPDDHDLLEWFNQWPDPQFREACEEYARETGKLAMKLMELIALSLGLPANKFKDYFKDQTSFMRLNHYPPCPFPHLALGVGRHKDPGCLTILAQDDVGGLEVRRKSDGEWISVKPTPDAYIVNVADIIQVWSNDRYESVEHRVMVNSEKERFSIPFFFNPAHDTVVKPLDELIDEQNPPKFRAFSWGKFLAHRSHSNFKKQNVENIQTYHFREACEEYARETGKLAMKLMELIARSLGLPANKFKDYFKDQTSFMRLNHYPPCPFPHLALAVGGHKDSGCLTVLAQDDVGGLEVRRKSDGKWISLKPTPHAYIINVGDMIHVQSNDRYECVKHRVMVNSEKERFSIPFFFNPAHYIVVQPLEELIDKQNPPKFRAYNWCKFLVNRGLINSKKLNVENIQTYHFRLQ